MKDLVVFGAGGHAREVHQLVEDVNSERSSWNVLGFLDDDPERVGDEVHALPVLGPRRWLASKKVAVVMGVGATPTRFRIVNALRRTTPGLEFPVLVHPRAWVGNRVGLGEGTILFTGSRLTTDLRLGAHVMVNLGCTVSHDSVVEDFVTLAPGVNVTGSVTVRVGCDIGAGVSFVQGVSVGEWSVVGAGAAVLRDLPANCTAVGVPATVIKERASGWHLEGP